MIGSCRGPRTVPADHLTTAPGVKAKIEEFAEPFLQAQRAFHPRQRRADAPINAKGTQRAG